MCGILFSLALPGENAVFDAALEAAAHRGPDGRGLRRFETAAGPVVLGHRRLAIIDTRDEALQPMSYEDERYWIDELSQILEGLPLAVVVYGKDRRPSYGNKRTFELLTNPVRNIRPDISAGRTLETAIEYYSLKKEGTNQP